MYRYLSLRSLFAILGLLGIVVYILLPERIRSESLVPASVKGAKFYMYDDSADGGGSRAYLSHSDTLVLFDFALGKNPGKSPYCGFGWDFSLKKRNWSFMDSLILEIRASGMQQVIVKVMTFDPDYTREGENNTLRPLIKEIAVNGEWRRIAIPVEELYVPEYWYKDNGISTRYDSKHLEGVVRVEIAPGWEEARGKPLGLQIRSFQASGASNLYFGLLVGWLLLLLIAAIGVRTPDRSSK